MGPHELQETERLAIQTEVNKALHKLNASASYRELLWTESLLSVASAITIDFPDVERVVNQYLDGDATKLMKFVLLWRQRHKAEDEE